MHMAVIAFQELLRRQWGIVECMGGQATTPVLIDEGVARRARGSQGAVALVDHLLGVNAFAGPSSCVSVRGRAHRAGGQERHPYGRREGRKRLACIGFARQGGVASCLEGGDLLGSLLA